MDFIYIYQNFGLNDEYMKTFKNYNCFCPMCGKLFIMEEYQGKLEIQIHKLKGELGDYKENNKPLQFEVKKGNYFYELTHKENHHIKNQNLTLDQVN